MIRKGLIGLLLTMALATVLLIGFHRGKATSFGLANSRVWKTNDGRIVYHVPGIHIKDSSLKVFYSSRNSSGAQFWRIGFAGFAFQRHPRLGGGYVVFNLWLTCIVLAAYPTIALASGPYRRHRRRKKGLCLTCGYNLTGNVSGVCPECGERI